MGEVYIVLEYVDDVEAQPISILGVYTHDEQAMKHALTFVDQDTIGGGSEYIDPPPGNILDAQVLQDPTRRIAIIRSPFIVGNKPQQRYTSERKIDVGENTVSTLPINNNYFPVVSGQNRFDDLSPRALSYNNTFRSDTRYSDLHIDDPFNPNYDAYADEESPRPRDLKTNGNGDYFGTEFEL